MRTHRPGRGNMLAFAVIFAGLVAAYCSIVGLTVVRPVVEPTVTPTIQVRVIPESPVPATATMRDIFTIPEPSPELIFATPLPTSTSTPTSEPTVTSEPTSTRVPATMVQRG